MSKALHYFFKRSPTQMFDWVLNTPLVLTIKYLHSSITAEFWFIHKLWMYFAPIKESKFSNLFIINITTFYLVNILNNSCKLNQIKQESWNLGPKLPYLGIFRLTFEKRLWQIWSNLKFFKAPSFVQKLKILKFGTKNPLFWNFWEI